MPEDSTQIFGMLKQGKITFGFGLKYTVPQRAICEDNKKANTITRGLMTNGLKIKTFV